MSITLHYTGATKFLQSQSDPTRSLGYYVSSSLVPNGAINGLFPSIPQQINSNLRDVRAIAIHNSGDVDITDLNVFYEQLSLDPISRYKMAIVQLAEDDCDGLFMEKVLSSDVLPVYASFVDNRTQDNAIILPTLSIGSYIGLWIVREVSQDLLREQNTCEKLFEVFELESSPSVVTIEAVADVADSLSGKYFKINSPQSQMYVWLDTGNSDNPNIPGLEGIRVSINIDDTADEVAQKISDQLELILQFRQEAELVVDQNIVTVTFSQHGPVLVSSPETSTFTITTQQGQSNDKEKQEAISLHFSW